MTKRRPLLRGALWTLAVVALAAVFTLYLRPDMMFSLATPTTGGMVAGPIGPARVNGVAGNDPER